MTYTLVANNTAILRSDGAYVPADPANTDYQTYLVWVAAGNQPAPASALSIAQQATALLSGTVAIASTSTPALNGDYSITPTDQAHISAVVTSILLNGTFPVGSSTYAWPDSSGTLHAFPSTTEFKAFATAVSNFIAQCIACQTGALSTLPSNALTIA